MSGLDQFPEWAAVLVALFVVAGAAITLTGAIGLMRFGSFFERVHAPTLGTSFGAAFILLASALYFSVLHGRPVLHEILIFIFVTVTTPVTLMLLARAALYRDRVETAPGPRPAATSEVGPASVNDADGKPRTT
jgi:multicomponent K+:H+ antiporter subunit G